MKAFPFIRPSITTLQFPSLPTTKRTTTATKSCYLNILLCPPVSTTRCDIAKCSALRRPFARSQLRHGATAQTRVQQFVGRLSRLLRHGQSTAFDRVANGGRIYGGRCHRNSTGAEEWNAAAFAISGRCLPTGYTQHCVPVHVVE